MSDRDRDKVEKGAVKEMIVGKLRKLEEQYNKLHKWPSITGGRRIKFDTTKLFAAIDALKPVADIQPPVEDPERSQRARTDVRSSERIEAAIRHLRKEYGRDKSDVWNDWELANAIAWASGLPQEENKGSFYPGLWTDKDLGLEEETKK